MIYMSLKFSKAELDLSHLIRSIPTRSVAVVDWNAVMGYREHELSYLMIRLPPTNEKVRYKLYNYLWNIQH